MGLFGLGKKKKKEKKEETSVTPKPVSLPDDEKTAEELFLSGNVL